MPIVNRKSFSDFSGLNLPSLNFAITLFMKDFGQLCFSNNDSNLTTCLHKKLLKEIFLARCNRHNIRPGFRVCGQIALKSSNNPVLVSFRQTQVLLPSSFAKHNLYV